MEFRVDKNSLQTMISPKDWEEVIFSEQIEINPKRQLKKGKIAKYISMVDLEAFQRRIENFTQREFKGGSRFKNGDTLLARITPCLENGKTAFVDILDDGEIGFGSTEFIVLSAKKGRTEPLYVYYIARSPIVRKTAIKSMTGTSGRQRVRTSVFDRIVISLPPVLEQKAISEILSNLDSKIELNRRMNGTLEAVGEAVFRRWFVDFEFPDEEGKPYKSSGGKMVYNDELQKEIPKEWKIADISKVTDVIDCLHSKKPERVKEGKVLLQVFNIVQNGELNLSDFYYVSDVDYDFWTRKIELKKGDLIISKTGRVGAIAQIPEGFKFGIGRNLVAIRPTKITPTFTLEYLLSKYGKRETQRLTMSGTILRSLHVKYIKKLQILVPPLRVINLYEKIARPFRARIENNIKENIALSQLRDILLPKLMSGKIRVPITEDKMEVC